MSDKEAFWLNKTQMSKALGISTQAFDKWGVDPVGKVGRETFFLVANLVDNRLEYHNQKHQTCKFDPKEFAAQRARLTKAQADAEEMKNAVMRRDLAPVDLLGMALATMSAQVSSILQSIPARVKKRVPSLTATQLGHISREITKAQNAASKSELPWNDVPERTIPSPSRLSMLSNMKASNPWESFNAKHDRNERITSTISRISDFGLFIALEGGIDGIVHLNDLDWTIPGDVAITQYNVGDSVVVVILSIDPERERISLGIKQLGPDPRPDRRDEPPSLAPVRPNRPKRPNPHAAATDRE